MGEKDNYFLIGLFVLATIVGVVTLLMTVGNDRASEQPQLLALSFSRDVSGLTQGAAVTYLGVRVGAVRGIKLSEQLHPSVEVIVGVDRSAPITTATYATLAYQGVTGIAVINLLDDPTVVAPILLEEADNSILSVPTRDSGIAALLAEGPEISGRLSDVLLRANTLLSDENLDRIERTLENLSAISNAVSSQSEVLAGIPQESYKFAARAAELAERLDALVLRLGPDLEATSTNLVLGTKNLVKLSDSLSDIQSRHGRVIDEAMSQGIGQLPELVSESRATLATLSLVLDGLERDPSRLLYRASSDDIVVEP